MKDEKEEKVVYLSDIVEMIGTILAKNTLTDIKFEQVLPTLPK